MTVEDSIRDGGLHQYKTITYSDMGISADNFAFKTDREDMGLTGTAFTVLSADIFNPGMSTNGILTILLVDEEEATTVYGMAQWKIN